MVTSQRFMNAAAMVMLLQVLAFGYYLRNPDCLLITTKVTAATWLVYLLLMAGALVSRILEWKREGYGPGESVLPHKDSSLAPFRRETNEGI